MKWFPTRKTIEKVEQYSKPMNPIQYEYNLEFLFIFQFSSPSKISRSQLLKRRYSTSNTYGA